jgi:hypothetical protein
MPYEVIELEVLDDFRLRVTFNDGVAGVVDVRPFLWGELFEPLLDEERFREAFLDKGMGTVAWPNSADLAPAALRDQLGVEEPTESVASGARSGRANDGGGELVTQGKDGKIRAKDTIGRPDPSSSRG